MQIEQLKTEIEMLSDEDFGRLRRWFAEKDRQLEDDFETWFAEYLGENKFQVSKWLNNRIPTYFLITWTIFETQCFNGSAKTSDLKSFAEKIVEMEGFERADFESFGRYFHNRYQATDPLRQLMHEKNDDKPSCMLKKLRPILDKNIDLLSDYDLVFMLLVVVIRYRNNIFHGNKKVSMWVNFKKQIQLCTETMRLLISLDRNSHQSN